MVSKPRHEVRQRSRAKEHVRPRKPLAELHKLTLSSIRCLRRTGANFIVPLISAAHALATGYSPEVAR
jgi:hypothetical protein